MDCSKTEVFFSEFHRMCEEDFFCDCHNRCEIFSLSDTVLGCRDWIVDNYEKAMEIVQKWSDEHHKGILDE